MNNYGKFIRHYRQKKGMTLEKLSDGICSLTHIHRIEKGERKPSIRVLELIASKLGFSLIECLILNEYANPEEAADILKCLRKMRKHNDLAGILEVYEKYKNSDYMESYPVGPAIMMSYCHYLTYSNESYKEAEKAILDELNKSNIKPLELSNYNVLDRININLLNIYATLHKLKGDLGIAYEILTNLRASLFQRRKHEYIGFLYVLVTHNLIHVKHLIEKNSLHQYMSSDWKSNTLELLLDLQEFQKKFELITGLPLTFIGLFEYYRDSDPSKANEYLNKAEMLAEVLGNKSYLEIVSASRKVHNL